MLEQRKIEEIKKLIEAGFKLELISLEYNISTEILKQYKMQIEKEQQKNDRKVKSISKLEEIRIRYEELLNDSEVKNMKLIGNTSRGYDKIEQIISKVEVLVKEWEFQDKEETRKKVIEILEEIKKTNKYEYTIEQSETLIGLLNTKTLQNLAIDKKNNVDFSIKKQKWIIYDKLAQAVEKEVDVTENIKELNELRRKLTPEMCKERYLSVKIVIDKINRKITKIQQQNSINRGKNGITVRIQKIIRDLAEDDLDIEEAKRVIEEEAKKKFESSSQNRFSLNIKQHEVQILVKIRKVLIEESENYKIRNPERAIEQLQKLAGEKNVCFLGTVIENMIKRKEYEGANSICDKYIQEDEENKIYYRKLKNEIKNAQISNLVLKILNEKKTPEEDEATFQLIKKGIEQGNVNLNQIVLGKTKSGKKDITLADIWGNEKKKINAR